MSTPSARRSPILVWCLAFFGTLALMALTACGGSDSTSNVTDKSTTVLRIDGIGSAVVDTDESPSDIVSGNRMFIVKAENNSAAMANLGDPS